MQRFDAYGHYHYKPICGLYYHESLSGSLQKTYLPQVEVKAHTNILATSSRTVLKQTFVNSDTARGIKEVRYMFPLYDGVSVVGFSCHVGNRLIVGEVKEKEKAKKVYKDAVARGETAGLLEQLPEASDVFTTTIGNIPPNTRIIVEITYLGELKHDMEVDGIRFTIPTSISPRYKVQRHTWNPFDRMDGSISITVDVEADESSFIQRLQSPSHPIAMSMGTTSADPNAAPSMSKASATLTLGVAHLETDFVLQIIAKDVGIPKAILETHPSIPNHRALMATLVPKFTLPPGDSEIVFVCDQSGSMEGTSMTLAKEALQLFLKSLRVGVKFNICSFGSRFSFLFPRSASYGQDTLERATKHAQSLRANYGGTEMLNPLKAVVENRYKDMSLDIILLTDGDTWKQEEVFDYLNEQVHVNKAPVRVFTLGVGSSVSHALIEGVAKAGNGFSQTVLEGEKMGSKVIRMLKGAQSPHVNDYTLEIKYSTMEEDDDFEIVEKVADSLQVKLDLKDKASEADNKAKKPISLFDTSADLDADVTPAGTTGEERYAHLPLIPAPKILQAPQSISTLFAFNRTTVYLLLGPDAPRATPTSVVLRATSAQGPLELEIPVQVLATPGETIHQLAAKKAVFELEQGRGWLASATDADGQLLKKRFDGRFSDMVEREAVRLGVQFQVGGKWCSFVATEKKIVTANGADEAVEGEWEFVDDAQPGRMQQQPQQQMQMQQQAQQWAQQQSRQQAQQQRSTRRQQLACPKKRRAGDCANGVTFASLDHASSAAPAMPKSSSSSSVLFGANNAPGPTHASNSPSGLFGGPSSSTPAPSFPPASQPTGGLFGGTSTSTASPTLFGTSQASQASALLTRPFGAPAPSGNALQDHQMGLMILEQQNRNRRVMVRADAAPGSNPFKRQCSTSTAFSASGAPTPYGSSSATASSQDPTSDDPAVKFTGYGSPSYSPASPTYSSTSLSDEEAPPCQGRAILASFDGSASAGGQNSFTPTSPSYSPKSPSFTPASPDYAPTSPFGQAQTSASPRFGALSPSPPPRAQSASPAYELNPVMRTPVEVMALLIAHQSFEGRFEYTRELLGWLGISREEFAGAVAEILGRMEGSEVVVKDVLATAMGVLFLENKVRECSGEWELVVEKARAWVGSQCVGEVEGKVWEVAARLVKEKSGH